MNILIVCSGNAPNFDLIKNQPFIYEQVDSIEKNNEAIKFDYFFIKGKGVKGYFLSLSSLKKKLNQKKYHLIHSHFGLSGLLSNLQRKVPVITTFHGCDVNRPFLRLFSVGAILLSKHNIFVSSQIQKKVSILSRSESSILPAGVDLNIFRALDKAQAKKDMGLDFQKVYVLFSGAFDTAVKNYSLARKALESVKHPNCELIELKGYSRQEVNLLMNACELGLLTSFREGSPMFIKELMATNTPIVSTDVGDVRHIIGDCEGCFIAKNDPVEIASKIDLALKFSNEKERTAGRDRIIELGLDSESVAKKLIDIYNRFHQG